jgi:hypothetical protein
MEEGVVMDEIHPYAVATFIESYIDPLMRHLVGGKAHPLTCEAGPP